MSNEQQFLKAIEAERDNRAARLVYGDWLKEQNDPRGDLLHIEEEMRTIPIFSDRYWELKPKRKKLRQKVATSWLETMNYASIDYEPVFGEVPDDWKERWRLIREFTDRWFEIDLGDVGSPAAKRPGRKRKPIKGRNPATGQEILIPTEPREAQMKSLPPSFREWFTFFAQMEAKKKQFLGTHLWSGSPNVDGMMFLDLGEGGQYFEVEEDQFRQPDPQVIYGNPDSGDTTTIPHLTTVALRYLFSNTSYLRGKAANGFFGDLQSSKLLLGRLKKALPSHTHFDGIDLFEDRNLIVLIGPNLRGSSLLELQVEAKGPGQQQNVLKLFGDYFKQGRYVGHGQFVDC